MKKNTEDNVCKELTYSAIFKKHAPDLHKMFYFKYGDQYNVKDKIQDAFIKLWENCKDVTPEKSRSFLYRVANNLILNEIAHSKVVLNYQKLPTKNATNESPEFIYQMHQFGEKIDHALSQLSAAQREAFLLNRIEGKKHPEIAEMLGISIKAVEKRVYGALKKMREQIKEMN